MTLNQAATRIAANAAAVATAMTSTSTAEATALAKLLTVMALRPGEAVPLLSIAMNSAVSPDTNLSAY